MQSAYDAEVTALAAACKMARETTVYTDCKSAIATACEYEHRTGIAHVLRISDGTAVVHKVQAHAERRKPEVEWTTEERGNVKADAAAAGREDDDGVRPTRLCLTDALRRVSPFFWKNSKGQIMLETVSTRSDRYTAKRDAWRASAPTPRPPRWHQVTNRLAAEMWHGKECSWAMAVRIMWDKHVTGENESKWNRQVQTRCAVCNALTSQRHIISECNRPGAAFIRQQTKRRFATAIAKRGTSISGRTLTVLQELMTHPDSHTIWTGMWTPAIREEVSRRCPWTLHAKEYRQVKQALSTLVDGVIQLYRLATPEDRKRKRGQGQVRTPRTLLEEWIAQDDEEDGGVQMRELDERDMDARRYDR